jgi:membrane protease subunit HflC
MKSVNGLAFLVVLVVVLVFAGASVFTVQQTEQALVLRFGDPVAGRGLVTEPGLHFKLPFIETVVLLDNRILDLETSKQEVLASDNTRIEVDSFLRYKITDPLRFYQSVGTIDRANNQLGFILNSAVRRVLGEANLTQIVRDARASLMNAIRDQVGQESAKLGVTAVDVRIRRADLPKDNTEAILSRMQSERQRVAAQARAEGAEASQRIKADAERERTVLVADARATADNLRGEGEAEATKTYADSFGQDPAFFSIWRTLQGYRNIFDAGSARLVVTPDNDYLHYLQAPPADPAK